MLDAKHLQAVECMLLLKFLNLSSSLFAETTSVWNYLFFVAVAIELRLLFIYCIDKNWFTLLLN
jgi:hypothetical protein